MKKFLTILMLIMFSANLAKAADEDINIYMIPRDAPTTKFFDNHNNAKTIQDYSKEFLIIVFWSRYCAPCLRELDNLNDFQKKARDNGIKVILISPENEWGTPSEEADLLKKYGVTELEHFVDRKGALKKDFGIFTSPYAILFNIKSQEIGRIKGAQSWDGSSFMEKIYKIKAESNEWLNKKPTPLMETGTFKSQELAPIGK